MSKKTERERAFMNIAEMKVGDFQRESDSAEKQN